MSKDKQRAVHTPGPWTYDRHDKNSKWHGNVIGHYANGNIRTITCNLKYGTEEENDANARLIAAAPELLEALEDAEFLLRKAGQLAGPMQASLNRSAEQARAAISKAF